MRKMGGKGLTKANMVVVRSMQRQLTVVAMVEDSVGWVLTKRFGRKMKKEGKRERKKRWKKYIKCFVVLNKAGGNLKKKYLCLLAT